MDHVELLFVKMSTNAVTPTRATEELVGLGFYSPANYMSCRRDGGRSQGDTRHSMPPVRRRGSFNFNDQLIPPLRGDGSGQAITA